MRFLIQLFITFLILFSSTSQAKLLPIHKLDLPKGFKLTVLTDEVPGARQMALGNNNTLFIGTRTIGNVYALKLSNDHTKVRSKKVIYKNGAMPNGVAFYRGDLFVAEIHRILKFKSIENNLSKPLKPEIFYDKLPAHVHHGWRVIGFSPNDQLTLSIGAPCNVCLKEDKQFASISQIDLSTKRLKVIAHGVRNSVGFDWDPLTQKLWFTDNGRDWLGDNIPPDELNRLDKAGDHFGFPYYYGDNQADPDFAKLAPNRVYQKPQQKLGPHVAALGMLFYTGKQFPSKYQNQIFIAEHGSWNRSKKIGYRITVVNLDKKRKAISYQPFVTGWLDKQNVWGRPVALLQLPDGSLLISDDYAGAIYRLSYDKNAV